MTGSQHPRWNNRIIGTEGYMMVRVGKSHPLADSKGYAYEHAMVVASAGCYMPMFDDVFHHINGDKLDNRIENLTIIPKWKHHRLHATQQRRDKKGRFARGRRKCQS